MPDGKFCTFKCCHIVRLLANLLHLVHTLQPNVLSNKKCFLGMSVNTTAETQNFCSTFQIKLSIADGVKNLPLGFFHMPQET